MKAFTELYTALDETNKTNEKVAALTSYLKAATPTDAAWAIYFLTGRKPKQLIQTPKVVAWGIEFANIPEWLFAESYDAVGDLAETIALLLPEPENSADESLTFWVEQKLLPLKGLSEVHQRELMLDAWRRLDQQQRYIWNKLITGAFRVGVSQQLVIRAISMVSGVDAATIAHRMMGAWEPNADFYTELTGADTGGSDVSRPYPFYLAYPFEADPETLGTIAEWQIEWKWDGIRSQVIKRNDEIFIWSRGEELITDRFPEIVEMAKGLPNGTAIDGEILTWKEANVLPFAMLQQRIGRKVVSKKMLEEIPVILMAYDLLEYKGKDIRAQALTERREILTRLACGLPDVHGDAQPLRAKSVSDFCQNAEGDEHEQIARDDAGNEEQQLHLPIKIAHSLNLNDNLEEAKLETMQAYGTCQRIDTRLRLSPLVVEESWEELLTTRQRARELNVEGLMLKRASSPYKVGRQRGDWWKWKVNPYTVDAVIISAQRGSGKRASLYSDYTFGVWDGETLVPIAKAYSGLTDEEVRKVDSFVRQNTLGKFGPVRVVKPELVFELGFEGIQKSSRHKSGVAVRFPRMLRWRLDKPANEADTIETLKALLPTQD
jgi:DNA ligase-1